MATTDAPKQSGKAAERELLAQLMPAVQAALLELGEEARLQALEQGPVETDALAFVASILRRKNPRRRERSLQAALAAAQRAKSAETTPRDVSVPPPPDAEQQNAVPSELSALEVSVLAEALEAGTVVSAGLGLPLLRRSGGAIEALSLGPAPPVDMDAALRAELDATRGRASGAIPPVMGSQPSIAVPRPPIVDVHKLQFGEPLRAWLRRAGWSSLGWPAGMIAELRAIASRCSASTGVRPLDPGQISFEGCQLESEPVVRQAIDSLAAACLDAETAPALLGLTPALLRAPAFRDAVACTPDVTSIGVAPLHSPGLSQAGEAWLGLAELCRRLPQLETIELRRQHLPCSEAAVLFEALSRTSLAELDLSGTSPAQSSATADDGGAALAFAVAPLLSCGNLRRLDWSQSGLGDDGGFVLFAGLRGAPRCGLRELDVSGSGLGESSGLELAELIRSSGSLARLSLSDNPQLFEAPATALAAIAEAIGGSSSLTHLEWRAPETVTMGHMERSAWGIAVARMLRSNRSLRTVDLSGQPLPASHPAADPQEEARAVGVAAALGHAAARHWALERLVLSRLELPDACLEALVAPLAAHPALSALDISCSSVGPLTAAALSELLLRPSYLSTIVARGCGIDSDGIAAITSSLRFNTRLAALDLSDNPMGVAAEASAPEVSEPDSVLTSPVVAAAEALASMLENNDSLRQLRIARCGLDQPEDPTMRKKSVTFSLDGLDEDDHSVGDVVSGSPDEDMVSPGDGNTGEGDEAEVQSEGGECQGGDEEPATPKPPAPPPLLGQLLGEALSKSRACGLELLDVSGNWLTDAGVVAFAKGLPRASQLTALYLRDCGGVGAHGELASAISAGSSLLLCDIVDEPLLPADAPPGRASAASPAAGSPTTGSLQLALCSNRWAAGKLWSSLVSAYPPRVAAAATLAFRSLPGATADEAPLSELVGRLLPPLVCARLSAWPATAVLPYGGFVQWLADFFCGAWDEAADDSPFASLVRLMAQPTTLRSEQDSLSANPSLLEVAGSALLRDKRRYRKQPKAKATVPEDAESLRSDALHRLASIVDSLSALEPGEEAGSTAVKETLRGMFAATCRVEDEHEPLHVVLPPELHVSAAEDVLEKTYRLEMQGMLRVEGPDAPADMAHTKPTFEHLPHGGAVLASGRCTFDDWDYFLDETAPDAWREWLHCLRWLSVGSSSSVLCRQETLLESGETTMRYEVLLEREFSAGVLRCALTAMQSNGDADGEAEAEGDDADAIAAEGAGEDMAATEDQDTTDETAADCNEVAREGAERKAPRLDWSLSALQVQISPSFVPPGPLATWHDTEPFKPPDGGTEQEAEENYRAATPRADDG
eukprot:CAMPEP_0196679716 /NCGR_PEP_ID=MMETSP1090-20130531/7282_1 /TAXON_ID=37098 /ORGANISM="Isochrysis sp, Strain CCMP1244" /LENGTH=1352 /DNA_ID=CAMNT_0042017981 /DNA_START=14 /DNA_END=4072 /DNA_ORIENTATION=-